MNRLFPFFALATFFLFGFAFSVKAQTLQGTHLFAQQDTTALYLDIYQPADEAPLSFEGKEKPTILFIFGGGFIGGERSNPYYMPWFKLLTDNGYRVVTIDYRLGLKGKHLRFSLFHLLETARLTKSAAEMGVEDLFSAVCYLSKHPETGVKMDNIVVAGSSAGAIISLTAEWEISNHTELAAVLPEGFNFVGVMSFAGAILSNQGKPSYAASPCPQLLIHGTADAIVNYDKTRLFNWGMFGSNVLAEVFEKEGYNYSIYRFKDHNHDMASCFVPTWPEQQRFLEENVLRGSVRIIDALVDDPAIPVWEDFGSLSSLYK